MSVNCSSSGPPPEVWDEYRVSRWLEQSGFNHLVKPLVFDHHLDGRGILSLTRSDLLDVVGIPVLGDVKRLLHAIRRLRLQNRQRRRSRNRRSSSSSSSKEDDSDDDDDDHRNGRSGSGDNLERNGCEISDDNPAESNDTKVCASCLNQKKKLFKKKSQSDPPPERRKALLAFIYSLLVSWMTAFVMVIVHDRVPDMNKYPPLPDILLDNIPHIPWAFEMTEVTGMVLLALWCAVVFFHKHRFVLMRRFFSISGTIFLLRCVTMLITSLSVPGKHLDCAPRPYGDIWNKYYNAYQIWTGAGLSTQGVRTCGDYMFSGHTVCLTLLNFFITEYTSTKIYFLHTFTWICNVFGIFFILAAHEHYSIDVFVAFYITSRLFLYYHTLANNRAYQSQKGTREGNRTWFWFPMFSYFEDKVDGKIPNEFECPITVEQIKDSFMRIIFILRLKQESLYARRRREQEFQMQKLTEVQQLLNNHKKYNNNNYNKSTMPLEKKQLLTKKKKK